MSKTCANYSGTCEIDFSHQIASADDKRCKDCGGIFFYNDKFRGEIICRNCGLVIESKMINYSDSIKPCLNFDEKMKIAHNAGPIGGSRVKDLFSKTSFQFRDCMHNPRFLRLMKIDSTKDPSLRSVSLSMVHLNRICTELSLPEHVKEESSSVFFKAWKIGALRGFSIELVTSACIYFACRKYRIARTLSEIGACSTLDPFRLSRVFSKVFSMLGLPLPRMDYIAFAEKYAKMLKLGPKQSSNLMKIMKSIKLSKFSGKNPLSIIGALIYIIQQADGKKISQKDISNVLNITEVTIRKRIYELKPLYNRIANI